MSKEAWFREAEPSRPSELVGPSSHWRDTGDCECCDEPCRGLPETRVYAHDYGRMYWCAGCPMPEDDGRTHCPKCEGEEDEPAEAAADVEVCHVCRTVVAPNGHCRCDDADAAYDAMKERALERRYGGA